METLHTREQPDLQVRAALTLEATFTAAKNIINRAQEALPGLSPQDSSNNQKRKRSRLPESPV